MHHKCISERNTVSLFKCQILNILSIKSKLEVPLTCNWMIAFICQGESPFPEASGGFSNMLWKYIFKTILSVDWNQTFGNQCLSFGPCMSVAGTGSFVYVVEISGPSPEYSSQAGPAKFWFYLSGAHKGTFVYYSLEFSFSKQGLNLFLEIIERAFLYALDWWGLD